MLAGSQRGVKRKRVYDEHRPMSDITNGIKSGTYHQVIILADPVHTHAIQHVLHAAGLKPA